MELRWLQAAWWPSQHKHVLLLKFQKKKLLLLGNFVQYVILDITEGAVFSRQVSSTIFFASVAYQKIWLCAHLENIMPLQKSCSWNAPNPNKSVQKWSSMLASMLYVSFSFMFSFLVSQVAHPIHNGKPDNHVYSCTRVLIMAQHHISSA